MNNVLIKDLEKLDAGFLKTCMAVAESYGLEGKLGLLENVTPGHLPVSTKDGFAISNSIRFADPIHNMGCMMAREVAAKTLSRSGDSTTSSLIFSKAFIENFPNRSEYNKSVERGLNIGYEEAVRQLKKLSKPTDKKTVEQIARVSANSDNFLASLIINAYEAVGASGVIELKKAHGTNETKVDILKGMKINKGFYSPFLINDQESVSWKGDDVLVATLEAWTSDTNIKNFVAKSRYKKDGVTLQPILLVFEKLEDANFVIDLERFMSRGLYNICAIVAPDSTKFEKMTHIGDISTYVDSEVYRPTEEVEDIKAGFASTVVVNTDMCSIIQKDVNEKTLELISNLKKQVSSTKDLDFLKQRIQRLEGVSCIISIAGHTQTEIDEKYDRAEDSLLSVKSALRHGFIPGGGSTLAYISAKMKRKFKNEDEAKGYNLIKTVLLEPLTQLSRNANRSERIEEHLEVSSKRYKFGYNAKTDKVSNLEKDGVIDSTFSILTAFENAKSVSEKLLNTSVIVTQTN